ncbi:hypothetical protein SmJEL517_g01504 [Synchytrium microbalum]|uniref:Monopolin complex subunit Csm1/Pcs1 C-terminal domain-containing protein n=1 Tax=Synchytrium microbalum TaxID=1806994 RepID=A0A507CE59_9FUNG|nr:uncharacterized protein SmJEL517_g01504 [Synchytrium microbalum]TPX36214.1 hypothetical protein SmJEL517_g01504 [Synchytrium microbalum]
MLTTQASTSKSRKHASTENDEDVQVLDQIPQNIQENAATKEPKSAAAKKKKKKKHTSKSNGSDAHDSVDAQNMMEVTPTETTTQSIHTVMGTYAPVIETPSIPDPPALLVEAVKPNTKTSNSKSASNESIQGEDTVMDAPVIETASIPVTLMVDKPVKPKKKKSNSTRALNGNQESNVVAPAVPVSDESKPVSESTPIISNESSGQARHFERLQAAYNDLQVKYEALRIKQIDQHLEAQIQLKKAAEERIQLSERTITTLTEEKEKISSKLAEETERRKELEVKLQSNGGSKLSSSKRVTEKVMEPETEVKTSISLSEFKALRKELDAAKSKAARASELESEIKQLRTQVTELESLRIQLATANETIASVTANVRTKDHNDRYALTLERMTRLYESFTGLTIQSVEETNVANDDGTGEAKMLVHKVCQKGNRGVLNYLFTTTQEPTPDAVYTYTPVNAANLEGLPQWLRQEIELDALQSQNFFWRTIDWMQNPQKSIA